MQTRTGFWTAIVSLAAAGLAVWQVDRSDGQFAIGAGLILSWLIPVVLFVLCRFGVPVIAGTIVAASFWCGVFVNVRIVTDGFSDLPSLLIAGGFVVGCTAVSWVGARLGQRWTSSEVDPTPTSNK